MADQLNLYPTGLTQSQFARLSHYATKAATQTPAQLGQEVQRHLEDTRLAYTRNRLVNLRLATALSDVVTDTLGRWGSLAPHARRWLAGACLYFARSNDEEPDFTSPIGFEDDAEILNACLRLAQFDDLCVKPEDYDDVE